MKIMIVSSAYPMPIFARCACGWDCGAGNVKPELRGRAILVAIGRHSKTCQRTTEG